MGRDPETPVKLIEVLVKLTEIAVKLTGIAVKLTETPVKLTEVDVTLAVEFTVTSVKFIQILIKMQQASFSVIGSGNITGKKCSCGKSTFAAYTAPGHLQLKTAIDSKTFAGSAFKASIVLVLTCSLIVSWL
jgi:hypothetical protein